MSEWPKERDWKSRTCRKVRRGFKSLPLRSSRGKLRFPRDLRSALCGGGPLRTSVSSPGTARSPSAYFGWPLLAHPGPRPARHARPARPRDLHLVVRVVAARDRELDEPVRQPRDLRAAGVNLTWTASAPGIALAFSPLTVLVGPSASYNVAALFLPALAAWTAFLLCRAPHRVALGLARRRLPVRLLELHARPRARGAPEPDRRLPRAARRARRSSATCAASSTVAGWRGGSGCSSHSSSRSRPRSR